MENKDVNNFNTFQKLEYIGENIDSLELNVSSYFLIPLFNDNLNYKQIIMLSLIQDLMKINEEWVKKSLDKFLLQICETAYYDEWRKYKHHEDCEKRRENIPSIISIYAKLIEWIDSF